MDIMAGYVWSDYGMCLLQSRGILISTMTNSHWDQDGVYTSFRNFNTTFQTSFVTKSDNQLREPVSKIKTWIVKHELDLYQNYHGLHP